MILFKTKDLNTRKNQESSPVVLSAAAVVAFSVVVSCDVTGIYKTEALIYVPLKLSSNDSFFANN